MPRSHGLCGFVVCVLSTSILVAARADDDSRRLLSEANQAAEKGNSAEAERLASEAIKADPKLAAAYYLRGRERFRLGKIRQSVADFDEYVRLKPAVESRQWERGIAYYYAKLFAQGAKQFELYQTFHDNDVENSVWRYLCVAREDGVEKARKNMLPIRNDTRVPMMQIYDLYRGKLKPEDVLRAAHAGAPDKQQLNRRLFYAHLYVGLFYEAEGKKELAKPHIIKAAEKHRIGHYMWDVAHVHAEMLRKESHNDE